MSMGVGRCIGEVWRSPGTDLRRPGGTWADTRPSKDTWAFSSTAKLVRLGPWALVWGRQYKQPLLALFFSHRSAQCPLVFLLSHTPCFLHIFWETGELFSWPCELAACLLPCGGWEGIRIAAEGARATRHPKPAWDLTILPCWLHSLSHRARRDTQTPVAMAVGAVTVCCPP